MVEINYRGGIYVGRCQGGLPEGKVLTLDDISVKVLFFSHIVWRRLRIMFHRVVCL